MFCEEVGHMTTNAMAISWEISPWQLLCQMISENAHALKAVPNNVHRIEKPDLPLNVSLGGGRRWYVEPLKQHGVKNCSFLLATRARRDHHVSHWVGHCATVAWVRDRAHRTLNTTSLTKRITSCSSWFTRKYASGISRRTSRTHNIKRYTTTACCTHLGCCSNRYWNACRSKRSCLVARPFHEAECGGGVGRDDGGAGHVKQLPLPVTNHVSLIWPQCKYYDISNHISSGSWYSYQLGNLPFTLQSSAGTFVEKEG